MSELAQQTLKDPYNFDFLTMRKDYTERELEPALTQHITNFLLELGKGFAFVGRQVRIEVAGDELKIDDFKPYYLGQLGFYVSAVNHQLKQADDKATIGLLICKTKNNVVVEYALESSNQPIGISAYELTKFIEQEFKGTLPSIGEIEAELNTCE
ncbi:hypothetical protein AwDysgo_21780 [Bacteroidales bacterium]|nr:hypothetical protein AwDysgo_21780 [Bacteroidales bacterium]